MPGSAALIAAALAAHPTPAVPLHPCQAVDVPLDAIERAFERAAQPVSVPPPHAPRRWTALVPARIWIGGHEGTRAGLAWVETAAGVDARWAQYADRALTFRVEWDLRDLVREPTERPPPPADSRLELALKAEQLARRLSEPLRALRKAQAQAAMVLQGDALCSDAQADAEAAAFVLWAAVRAGQGPASPAVAGPVAAAAATPTPRAWTAPKPAEPRAPPTTSYPPPCPAHPAGPGRGCRP